MHLATIALLCKQTTDNFRTRYPPEPRWRHLSGNRISFVPHWHVILWMGLSARSADLKWNPQQGMIIGELGRPCFISSVLQFLARVFYNHVQFYSKSNSESFSNLLHGLIVSHISICRCLQGDIFHNFLHFCVLSLFLLREMWPCKSIKAFWLNYVFYQVLIIITSNLLHWLIVSYLSICWWLQVDIYFIIFVRFSVFLLNVAW